MLIGKKKVNTENIRTKSQINTLPVGWGIRKIHIKIYFKKQIILEKSLFPKGKHFIEPDVKSSSTQINADDGIPFSRRKIKLTWELIGYWMVEEF